MCKGKIYNHRVPDPGFKMSAFQFKSILQRLLFAPGGFRPGCRVSPGPGPKLENVSFSIKLLSKSDSFQPPGCFWPGCLLSPGPGPQLQNVNFSIKTLLKRYYFRPPAASSQNAIYHRVPAPGFKMIAFQLNSF